MVIDVHLQFVFISKFLSSTPISTVQSVYISDNLNYVNLNAFLMAAGTFVPDLGHTPHMRSTDIINIVARPAHQ